MRERESVCVYVCVRGERGERERECVCEREIANERECVCVRERESVCVCMWCERERREMGGFFYRTSLFIYGIREAEAPFFSVCVVCCVCERDRERCVCVWCERER